jgi:hypothetical protein
MVAEVSTIRGQRRKYRLERLKAARPSHGVRVVPASEELRKVLKHPNGIGFRKQGGIEWPNDRFTKRRLADGSVKLEEPPDKGSKPKQQPTEDSSAA